MIQQAHDRENRGFAASILALITSSIDHFQCLLVCIYTLLRVTFFAMCIIEKWHHLVVLTVFSSFFK